VPESVANGPASQYTRLGVERRASSATGVRENILRPETELGSILKASRVRILNFFFRSGSRILTAVAVLVKGLDDKKIVQIACGQQHSIALDEDGYAPISILGYADLQMPNTVLYGSGAIMVIAVSASGIRKTF